VRGRRLLVSHARGTRIDRSHRGGGRLRRPAVAARWSSVALAGLAVAVGLGGCESTQEKSARLEHEAKRVTFSQKGLRIATASRAVAVLAVAVVHDSEGAAVAVTVRNDSGSALRAVPLAIDVRDAGGRVVYENDSAGLEAALTSIPSLAAHSTLTWVDDQVPANGEPTRGSAEVGEADTLSGEAPRIAISGLHAIEDPNNGQGAAGTVSNRSRIAQSNLPVFVIARRGSAIVAAARAILPSLAAGASAPFQAFFIGSAGGATLEASAPAVSL